MCVRGDAGGRVWQTNFEPGEPLRWRWGRADGAVLSLTNFMTRKSARISIARADGETYGAYAVEMPAAFWTDGREVLCDVSLTRLSGETVLSEETARIAWLPGANGAAGQTVRGDAKWGDVDAPVALAWDVAWGDAAVAALAAATPDGGTAVALPSDGASGYAPFDLQRMFATAPAADVTLSFDGAVYATARCRWIAGGFTVILR